MLKRLTSIMPLFGGALFAGGGRLPLAVTGLVAALVVAGLVALSLNSPTEASEGPEEESASLDIHFDSVPTGWSVMSGTASTVGAASAHWTKQRMIRYSLSGHSAFSIKKMKGTVAYDGSEIDAASVSLTINARHRTGAVEGASITVSVTVNQPVLAEGERLTRQDPQPSFSENVINPDSEHDLNNPKGIPPAYEPIYCEHDRLDDQTCTPRAEPRNPSTPTINYGVGHWSWHEGLGKWVIANSGAVDVPAAKCRWHDHAGTNPDGTSWAVRHNNCGTDIPDEHQREHKAVGTKEHSHAKGPNYLREEKIQRAADPVVGCAKHFHRTHSDPDQGGYRSHRHSFGCTNDTKSQLAYHSKRGGVLTQWSPHGAK